MDVRPRTSVVDRTPISEHPARSPAPLVTEVGPSQGVGTVLLVVDLRSVAAGPRGSPEAADAGEVISYTTRTFIIQRPWMGVLALARHPSRVFILYNW